MDNLVNLLIADLIRLDGVEKINVSAYPHQIRPFENLQDKLTFIHARTQVHYVARPHGAQTICATESN